MRYDRQQLDEQVRQGWLTRHAHPDNDDHIRLYLYNYTSKAQFEGHWTPDFMGDCRGLILNEQGDVVARPFRKFFNLSEHGPEFQLPRERFVAQTKLDGSLGILHRDPRGDLSIATRGSFTSPQALHGTQVLRARHGDLPFDVDRCTYLFEIIYEGSRVVVNYGDRDELVLIAVIDNETGRDLPLPGWFPRRVDEIDLGDDPEALRQVHLSNTQNEEGYVIRFAGSGLRIKIKFGDYIRLHRLINGITPRRVLDILRAGTSLDEFLRDTPEEFADWVRTTAGEFTRRAGLVREDCLRNYRDIAHLPTRRDQAQAIKHLPRQRQRVIFNLLDGRDSTQTIWDIVEEEG